jgi:type II secretory pathway pseudopilin PulG
MSLKTGTNRWRGGVVAALLMTVWASGCNDAKKQIQSASNMKQIEHAISMYEREHKAWPDSLEQVKPLMIANGMDFATLMKNPLTGDNPGYEYVKPPATGGDGVVLYQLRNGKRDATVEVAYIDGSVRKIGT